MADPIDELGPGTGTAADPFIIKDLVTLDAMRNEPAAHYMMVSGVDIGGGLWESFTFSGVLDGRGYKITNLQIDSSGYVGFFSQLYDGAEVRNLAIYTGGPTHITKPSDSYAGVLCGNMQGSAHVSNVLCTGVINTGGDRTGGIAGRIDLSIGGIRSSVALVEIVGGGTSGRTGSVAGYTYPGFYNQGVIYSAEYSGESDAIGTDAGDGVSTNLSISALASQANYPDSFHMDNELWAIDENGYPFLTPQPVPIIDTGGGSGPAPAQARLAGMVTVDETPVERRVIIVNNHPDGPQVVGEGVSNPDGSFDIEYGDFGVSVVALSIDEYGQPFEPETALNLGTIVHPTTPNGYVYEVTQAGTTGTEEPDWATVQTVQSGSVTFNPLPYYRPIASGPLTGEPVV